jgi:hypothetical protein
MSSSKLQIYFKMIAFWDIAPCSLEVDRRFRGALIMEAVCASETSVYFNDTIRRYIPEGCIFIIATMTT